MSEHLDSSAEERRNLLVAMNAGYARLRADPQAWAEELAERELWDQTLADGVEQDEIAPAFDAPLEECRE